MVSPFWSAIDTTVSTSKVNASSNSLRACYKAAVCICGTMAAILASAICSAICCISARCCSARPPCPSCVLVLMAHRFPGTLPEELKRKSYIVFPPYGGGWVLVLLEMRFSKTPITWPHRFLNQFYKAGNRRSTSSISCLISLYYSGK